MSSLFDVIGATTRRTKRVIIQLADVDGAYDSGDVITAGGAPVEVVCAGLEPDGLVEIESIVIREKAATGAAQKMAMRVVLTSETYALPAQNDALKIPSDGRAKFIDIASATYKDATGTDNSVWAVSETDNIGKVIPCSSGGRSFFVALAANEGAKTFAPSAVLELEIVYHQDVQ